MLARLIVYSICLALCGCTALQQVPDAVAGPQIFAGNALRVTFNDGSKRELTVVAVEPDFFTALPTQSKTALIEEFRYSAVARIERREVSNFRTALLVLGIVAIGIGSSFELQWGSAAAL